MMELHEQSVGLLERSIPSGLNRRSFLKRFGGGLIIAVSLSDFDVLQASIAQQYPADFNAYLKIAPNGKVTGYTGKIEMGQGVNTSLAQMLAEELDVKLSDVTMIMGDTDLCPYDQGTWGSQTTRIFGPALRSAAAEARAILLNMASEKLGVSVGNLSVQEGVVFVKTDKNRKITYGELANGSKIARTLTGKPSLKNPKDFKIIGKSISRSDAIDKVTGAAKFSGDIRLPGMLHAKILRPPSHDARLTSVDTSAARNVPGLTLVEQDGLVAVLHEDPETAELYLSKIKADYNIPAPKVDDKTIFDHIVSSAPEGSAVAEGGDVQQGLKSADITIESEFKDGYVAHAPMEPHTAVATMENGKLKVWASTQNPFGLRSSLAGEFNMKEEDVIVHEVLLGGGFGGKSANEQAMEAARLAKITGKPVMMAWTRAEEFFYDTFRPAAVVKIQSGCTKDGRITGWDYGVYLAGQRGAAHFYNIPNHKTIAFGTGWTARGVHPFATGAWRAPANNTNTFARESQIDIMAAKCGMDPVEFRLKNLTDERMIRTLKAAAEKFGWKKFKMPSGKGIGVACGADAGSYVALIGQVKVDKKTGDVIVERVVVAQDMGLVINPLGATIQAESCVIMGLGYALSETLHFSGGTIHDRNFDSYKIPRFSWTPAIEVALLDLPDEPAQGGGEPAIICMGALIANAIFDAAGVRLYQMPMTPERILDALKEKA